MASAVPVYRCKEGFPVVIESAGLTEEGRPFPTLYWLTCPDLVRRIARLEAAGLIAEMRALLESDPHIKRRLLASDALYRKRRDSHTGIAGCRDALKLKCLHAHVADWLAAGVNPVGERVSALCPLPADCRLCGEA